MTNFRDRMGSVETILKRRMSSFCRLGLWRRELTEGRDESNMSVEGTSGVDVEYELISK